MISTFLNQPEILEVGKNRTPIFKEEKNIMPLGTNQAGQETE